MLSKRIIPCLDVREGRTTKGIKFKNNVDIGDPVDMARLYYEAGADEIVFYDITASYEKRDIMLDVVKRVAETIFIPFSVGGGIRTVEDMRNVLLAGAEKVSVNSAAVKNPDLIAEGARAFGNQCIVLGMDAKFTGKTEKTPCGYEIYINGGRTPMGIDALNWAVEAQELGAGEICLNSMDADGTKGGYDLEFTSAISDAVDLPVVASGGAGTLEHFYDGVVKGGAQTLLAASVFHYRILSVKQVKEYLKEKGLQVKT